ncbi:hypothetical protein [Aliidiomarina haloalkalitolerans]|uniref:Restriction endonuclease n=1 Tax=Aliidiomarina haloalkalitolerans TaxID=859059 RepID=A0A432VRL9_9GAMM|nr:hypothetical protein [Aliidiomarina haloalkalitolerans]RUO18935.1 hypothetical protein CWE06_10095 [Aliidiomarina haloalkalitolerans]
MPFDILSDLVSLLNGPLNKKTEGKTGISLEPVVENALISISSKHNIQEIVLISGHKFPDITFKVNGRTFGLEVKTTSSQRWSSMGGSIMETTKIEGLEDIFILFGMFGGTRPEFKWRRFEECADNIKITHSPRYTINMDTPDGGSIFNKIGVSYEQVSGLENKFSVFRSYLKSQANPGEDVWWLPESEEIDEQQSSFVKAFDSLDSSLQTRITTEILVLFPELFGNKSRSKYYRASAYMVSRYSVTDHCLRDRFTAGGKVYVAEIGEKVPKMMCFLSDELVFQSLIDCLNNLDLELLTEYWEIPTAEISQNGKVRSWYKLLKKQINNNNAYYLGPLLRSAFRKYIVPN